MTEPIVRCGIAGTCGDGQGMLIEQHERIVGQQWSALVAEIAERNGQLADAQAEIERLTQPLSSDEEKSIVTRAFDKERERVWEPSFYRGSIEESTWAAVNALIASRAAVVRESARVELGEK